MSRILLSLLILVASTGFSQPSEPEPLKIKTIEELAEEADLIAIAIVEQTEYEKTRSFPSKGWALLKVLIPYKGSVKGQIFQVGEQGLGDDKCYFPEVSGLDYEGQRFLVVLKKVAQANYIGVAPSCRIPILVTSNSGYAIRYPVSGLEMENQEQLAREMTFADPSAYIDATDYTFAKIDELEQYYKARKLEPNEFEPEIVKYVYTQGIPVKHIRSLLKIP